MRLIKCISAFLLSVIAISGFGASASMCLIKVDTSDKDNSNDTDGDQALEQFIKDVVIKTQPTKTKYVCGESIDLSGLTFDVVRSINGEEVTVSNLTYEDLESFDEIATREMDAVNCKIGGYTFRVAITVFTMSDMYSTLNIERIDGTDNVSVIKGTDFFETYKIKAVGKNGYSDKQLAKSECLFFKAKRDEVEDIVDSSQIFNYPGNTEIAVMWHGLEGKLSVNVINGYMIYGKDMIKTADITSENKNFLEKDETSEELQVRTNAGVSYAGEIRNGYHLIFHVWSSVAKNANILLYASSTVRTYWAGYPSSAHQWYPTETASIQFNEVFSVTYGKDVKTDILISDDVVLPGNESKITNVEDCTDSFKEKDDKGRYFDDSIWVNWKIVELGTIPLEVGDNVITLTNIKANVANVYALEAQFVD